MTTRRTFLTGMAAILASGMAPASARSGVLMPIRPAIYVPEVLVFKRHMPFPMEIGRIDGFRLIVSDQLPENPLHPAENR